MKLNLNKPKSLEFSDLKVGDIFLYSNHAYVRVDNFLPNGVNAILLGPGDYTGRVLVRFDVQNVQVIDCEINVTTKS